MANDQDSNDPTLNPIDDVWGGQLLIQESQRRIELTWQLRQDPAYLDLEEHLTGNLPPSHERNIGKAARAGNVETYDRATGTWVSDPEYRPPTEHLEPPTSHGKERG